MNTKWTLIAAIGLMVACKTDEDPSKTEYLDSATPGDDGGDEGGDSSSGTGDEDCEVVVANLTPESGSTGVYYRDYFEVTFDEDARDLGATATLLDSAGTDIGVSMSFDDTGYKASLTPASPLEANTEYTLTVDVCVDSSSAIFTTSDYGASLGIDPAALIGATYNFSLGEAEYTQPEGLGPVLASFLTEPLLIGISDASATQMRILGTQGTESGGSVEPDSDYDIWDFGDAVLEGAYFKSAPTNIELGYDCASIPIYDFTLQGTFAADGSSIGGGSATGLGDSRDMGCLIGAGSDPAALCNYAAAVGFTCETCPDGNPYCLTIEAWFEPAILVPDVALSLE
jgi:hypothetical protein